MERLLKIEDICKMLGVSRHTVYQWTHQQKIPHIKLPKGIRFRKERIERWIKNKEVKVRSSHKIDI